MSQHSKPYTGPGRRWYDKDPILAKALQELRHASSAYQAQVVINLIKIMVEHRLEAELSEPAELLADLPSQLMQADAQPRRRWYDADQTLQAALQLLQECPADLHERVLPTVTRMVEKTLSMSFVA